MRARWHQEYLIYTLHQVIRMLCNPICVFNNFMQIWECIFLKTVLCQQNFRKYIYCWNFWWNSDCCINRIGKRDALEAKKSYKTWKYQTRFESALMSSSGQCGTDLPLTDLSVALFTWNTWECAQWVQRTSQYHLRYDEVYVYEDNFRMNT